MTQRGAEERGLKTKGSREDAGRESREGAQKRARGFKRGFRRNSRTDSKERAQAKT